MRKDAATSSERARSRRRAANRSNRGRAASRLPDRKRKPSTADSCVQAEGDKVKCTATIRNQRGLHARAAAKFAKLAGGFDAKVSVSKGGQTVSGLSIMGLMMLAAAPGSEIEINITGRQAKQALEALRLLIEANFEEG